MKNLFSSIQILFFLSFLSACQQLKPEKPEIEMASSPIENKLSQIDFPVSYEIKRMEKLINRKLKEVLYEDLSFENNEKDNLKLVVKRAGKIEMSAKDNVLAYNLPLNIWLQKKVLGKGKDGYEEDKGIDFTVNLYLESSVTVGRSWKLYTQTKLKELVWEKEPMFRVTFFKINLKKVIENFLAKNEDILIKRIDQSISEGIDLKKMMQKVWVDIQKPMLINKKIHEVWLKSEPKEIWLGKLLTKRGKLIIPVSLSTYFTTLYGSSPSWQPNKTLPPLKLNPENYSGFDIHVLAKIPHREINVALASGFHKKEIEVEGHSIKINKAEVFGGGEKLFVRLSVKGDVDGDVYFQGKPAFDANKTMLFVDEFDFELKTQEALLSAADWLLHSSVRQQIQDVLYLPLENVVENLPELIYSGVEKGKSGERLSLSINKIDVEVNEILVTEHDIQVLLGAKGKANLELENL